MSQNTRSFKITVFALTVLGLVLVRAVRPQPIATRLLYAETAVNGTTKIWAVNPALQIVAR